MPRSLLQCCARHAPLNLFDFVTCTIYSRSLYGATSQQHDLWQWCNGKAIEGAGGAPSNSSLTLFEKVTFRATTPASAIVRATFSWPIYLLFLFSSSGSCLKNVATDFLFLSNDYWRWNKVRVRWKAPVFVRFEIFRKVNLPTLKFCGNFW